MLKLRPYLIVLTLLATALAPLAGSALNVPSLGSPSAFAAPALAPASQNDNNDNEEDNNNNGNANDNLNNNNDNIDNNNDNDDDNTNDNDGNNNNDNDNGNDNDDDVDDGDDNDNDADVVPVSPGSSEPAPPPAPSSTTSEECSTPGQEMTFTSGDGRVQVRVFPSLTESVRFSISMPIDPASVPPAPGPVVGGLLFQLIATSCDGTPIATLPAEVNLGVHYSDADAAGLNEQSFKLARLDTSANQWRDAAKQATDPPANFTSATITDMGIYVLTQH